MRPIEEGALNGAFVLRHREILRETAGNDAFAAALRDLEPDVRVAIEQAPHPGWVPVEAVEALFAAVSQRIARDPKLLHAEVVALATEHTIQTVWRILSRLTTDAHLVSQTPVIYRKAWNRGSLTVDAVSKGRATLRLSSWPGVPDFTARGLQVAIERVLTLAGRKQVSLAFKPTADGVEYTASWT